MPRIHVHSNVSIHASAWEATCVRAVLRQVACVSIHASAWEATLGTSASATEDDVSIHASAWEATIPAAMLLNVTPFQSTPPHGRRPGA